MPETLSSTTEALTTLLGAVARRAARMDPIEALRHE